MAAKDSETVFEQIRRSLEERLSIKVDPEQLKKEEAEWNGGLPLQLISAIRSHNKKKSKKVILETKKEGD